MFKSPLTVSEKADDVSLVDSRNFVLPVLTTFLCTDLSPVSTLSLPKPNWLLVSMSVLCSHVYVNDFKFPLTL